VFANLIIEQKVKLRYFKNELDYVGNLPGRVVNLNKNKRAYKEDCR